MSRGLIIPGIKLTPFLFIMLFLDKLQIFSRKEVSLKWQIITIMVMVTVIAGWVF